MFERLASVALINATSCYIKSEIPQTYLLNRSTILGKLFYLLQNGKQIINELLLRCDNLLNYFIGQRVNNLIYYYILTILSKNVYNLEFIVRVKY